MIRKEGTVIPLRYLELAVRWRSGGGGEADFSLGHLSSEIHMRHLRRDIKEADR